MLLIGVSIGSAVFFICLALFGAKVKQVLDGSRLGRALARHPLNRGMTVGISHESLTWDDGAHHVRESLELSTYRARDDSNVSAKTTTTTVFVDDRGETDTSAGIEPASQNVIHTTATVHATGPASSPFSKVTSCTERGESERVTSSTETGESERKITTEGREGDDAIELAAIPGSAAEVERSRGIVAGDVETTFTA